VVKPRQNKPYCSPAVEKLLARAEDGQRLTVMLRYQPGIKPFDAAAAYGQDVPGLEIAPDYPPLLHVTGDKRRLRMALAHTLTVGAVADYQDYASYLQPTSRQRERS
jgi:hypothetical protein